MTPFVWSIIALAVGAAGGFFIGIGKARDADEATITGLRQALVRTQNAVVDANAVRDEAVAAQEAAEEQLKQAHERKSLAGRRAWVTRKSKVRDGVAD